LLIAGGGFIEAKNGFRGQAGKFCARQKWKGQDLRGGGVLVGMMWTRKKTRVRKQTRQTLKEKTGQIVKQAPT